MEFTYGKCSIEARFKKANGITGDQSPTPVLYNEWLFVSQLSIQIIIASKGISHP
jgi:hypothetical protein